MYDMYLGWYELMWYGDPQEDNWHAVYEMYIDNKDERRCIINWNHTTGQSTLRFHS